MNKNNKRKITILEGRRVVIHSNDKKDCTRYYFIRIKYENLETGYKNKRDLYYNNEQEMKEKYELFIKKIKQKDNE